MVFKLSGGKVTVRRNDIVLFSLLSLLMFSGLFYIDIPLSQWVFSQSKDFRNFCENLSWFGESTYYLIFSFLGFLFFRFYNYDKILYNKFLFFFSAVAVSGIIVNILKVIFGRMRPWFLENEGISGFVFFKAGTPYASFPSGHSTTAFSICMALCILFPRFEGLWILFAVAMAFARIGEGDHFFSDTAAGAILGIATSLLLYRYFFRNLMKTRGE